MPRQRVVGVLPDVTGVDKIFFYAVPPDLDALIRLGVVVRVPLGSRRVRGWVVEDPADRSAEVDVALRPIQAFVSLGPSSEILDLARYGVWRYTGRLRSFLVAATPVRNVKELPVPRERGEHGMGHGEQSLSASLGVDDEVAGGIRALFQRVGDAEANELPSVLRLPPATSRLEIAVSVRAQLDLESTAATLLVLLPEHSDVERLVSLLRQGGQTVAVYPNDWSVAKSGARIVVGTRSAVLAPIDDLGAILVIDAEAEAYVNERTPTWRASVLAAERARRRAIRCLLVSSTPSLDVLGSNSPLAVSPLYERAGWPHVEVIDRRGDDPRAGLFAGSLAEIVREARAAEPNRSVVAVLNRTGRARLLACVNCGLLVGCERCGAALIEAILSPSEPVTEVSSLICPRCKLSRPTICSECHSTRLKRLRIGVARAAEEFAALVGEPAAEVTGTSRELPPGVGLFVGTEAVLHRVRAASLVVMLDFDQELGAKRLRGAEHALGLLARAGRLVGGRKVTRSGFARRVVIQTRTPEHVVIRAALTGDPGLVEAQEVVTRKALRLPPFAALALVSGEDATAFVTELTDSDGLEVGAEDSHGYLVRAQSSLALCDALQSASTSGRELRIEVDPEHV